MNKGLRSEGKQQIVSFQVHTRQPEKIVVQLKDANRPATYYINRTDTVNGTETYYLRLPQSPQVAVLSIYNKRIGNKPDITFNVSGFDTKPLNKKLNVFQTKYSTVKRFLKFAQEFSERASVLSDIIPEGASIYTSDDGQFVIKYVDLIRDLNTEIPDRRDPSGKTFIKNPNYGRVLTTPARISKDKGIIEISKHYFLQYTIPMRMAILLHEFSHFYLNNDPRSEIEADKNALMIYLSMGYPRREAYETFLEVFKQADTAQNRERYDILKKFIDDFENKNYSLLPY